MHRLIDRHAQFVFSILVLMAVSRPVFGHEHILIGHNAAGELKAHFHQEEPLRLQVSTIEGIKGWTAGGPGIESLSKDEPDEDFFVLPSSVQIDVVLVAIDPDLHLFADGGSGFVPEGGSYVVLSPFFHWHPFWNLTEGEYGSIYQAQFQFHDKSGQFTGSPAITIEFAPACPGDVNLSTAVDVDDLLEVINSWGECPGGCEDTCHADLDQTCVVDVDDLLSVINAWGECVR